MNNNTYDKLQGVVSKLMNTLFKPEIEYESEIPSDKVIFAGNHTSNWDSLLLASTLNKPVHFLAKKELFKGLLKPILNSLECIPVNRDGHGMESIKTSVDYLNNNESILIFPEGKINQTENLVLPFKLGTVIIAKRSKSNIVPFSITGDYKLVKNNLKLTFGTPIKPDDYTSKELFDKLESDVKTLILKNK